jgi:hypothetical protein
MTKSLSGWEIVALETGKLDGPSYGNKCISSRGSECCSKKAIIKL